MPLEMGRTRDALSEYEKSLKTDPNRFNGLYGGGRAAELAPQPKKAAGYYAQLLKNCENQASSVRPEIAHARAFLARMRALPAGTRKGATSSASP
jgi:tetratricopeptide (TPR) repeat protein